MPEIPVAALDARQQKLIENARIALGRGELEYVLEVTAQVLRSQPGCLPVRKLHRVAQLRQHRVKGRGFVARALGWSAAPLVFAARKDPAKAIESAEHVLHKDPASVAGLRMLAGAAAQLGWRETVAFALEAIRELEPANRANLLALGEAWLAVARPADALQIADALLRDQPADGDAQDLMRRASVAQTVAAHSWEEKSTYRDKLRDEARAVSLEQTVKAVNAEATTQRLLDEAIARVAREPNHLNHHRSVAQAYRQLGNVDEALAWVRKARQLPAGQGDAALEKQESELVIALAEIHVREAERAVAAAPGDRVVQAKLAAAKQELADVRLADAKRVVERYPNDHAARHALGTRLLELGHIDGAIAQFQRAQKGAAVRVLALIGLGRCFKAKRLYDLAIAPLKAAKDELGPMDDTKKDVLYELGTCYELMRQPELAIEEFKTIYSEDIGFRDVAGRINTFYSTA